MASLCLAGGHSETRCAIADGGRKSRSMKRGLVCFGLIGALLFASALTASPHLHERIHSDANQPHHECAITLIAAGNYDHAIAAPVFEPPTPLVQFSKLPTLNSIWVASLFLSARIFEHAPPAIA